MSINAVSGGDKTAILGTALQGTEKAKEALERTARAIAQGDVTHRRFVDLMIDHRTYSSNLELIKAYDERVGTMLDLVG